MTATDKYSGKKIVFWWNIPCAGMINVLKAYCENIAPDTLVVTGPLSNSRKAMGWADSGRMFSSHIIIPDEQWDEDSKRLLAKYTDRLHVFNGITYTPKMARTIRHAIETGIDFCNMSEAYFNLERGWKRWAKDIYIKFRIPVKARNVVSKSKGILCLSGNSERDIKQFRNIGFKSDDIYPFGYYTDETKGFLYKKASDGKIHILCPGLLEYYKGVDILIKGIRIAVLRGADNFICHITGSGKEKDKLENIVTKYSLDHFIKFEGVLNSKDYGQLLSGIDILVAPGRVEPWGIRINEAIQRGNAVVVSDGLGGSCLIKASKGGAVFSSGNPEDLADKLFPLLTEMDRLTEAKHNNLAFKEEISCHRQAELLHGIITRIQQKYEL